MPLFQFSWIELGCNVKMTGVKLEKISDIGKYLFIEKGLRGENSYIFNNLYGWAMSEFLPYGRFK